VRSYVCVCVCVCVCVWSLSNHHAHTHTHHLSLTPGSYTIVVEGNGNVEERTLADHAPGSVLA
jgi:hypothetical protein